MLMLITGGARSGKSRYAEALARHYALGYTQDEHDVTYIATLSASDDEMQRRIHRHQQQRPARWRTIEAPHNLSNAMTQTHTRVVLIDCLSGFVANVLMQHEQAGEDAAVARCLQGVSDALELIKQRNQTVIIVSNEVGYGVVPAYPLGRWYRDALGLANQHVARAADAVSLVTVGIPQTLKGNFPNDIT